NQPPNQPPQGGFGAPQEPSFNPPPQGGFGAPQPGHPGAHPGYPGAPQPGPYGGPTPPYGPYGPLTPPPSGRNNKRTAVVIGTAVAVVLAIGGGVWAVSGGDEEKKPEAGKSAEARPDDDKGGAENERDAGGGSDGEAGGRPGTDDGLTGVGGGDESTVLWQKQAPDVPKSGVDSPGLWITDGLAVKAALETVTAYDVADGKEEWSVSVDGTICAAPKNATADNKIVVAYEGEKKDECSHLAMVDLTTGKKQWNKPMPDGGGFGSGFIGTALAISGDTVAAGWFGGSAMFRVGDGKELPKGDRVSGCTAGGFAGGPYLLRALSCTAGGQLQKLDPDTRKVEWTFKAPKGYNINNVFSTDPVVISLSDEDNKSGGIHAIENGKVRATLDLGKDTYQPRCGMQIMSEELDACQGVAATADTFFIPTEPKEASEGYGRTSEVHAFDLDSGKRKWKSSAGENTTLLPLGVDGGNLIAYREPSYDKGGEILSIGPKGGTPKSLMKNPAAAAEAENGFYSSRLAYVDGRFFIASDRVTGTSSGGVERLMLVYGDK
ncbi:PQQ-binding-like beta-propeller repeat protein, partial [Streptomyces sp. Ru87]|uniref:outer membrane protein assembly factor BamB family protein n=1 Tax=Streptomyces sp. Ru87 TaxID=2044307 RepID=UPI000BF5ABD7